MFDSTVGRNSMHDKGSLVYWSGRKGLQLIAHFIFTRTRHHAVSWLSTSNDEPYAV